MNPVMAVCLVLALTGAGRIQDIRDLYFQTNAEIEAGGFYTTVVNMNSEDLSFPAVGVFVRTTTFHWLAEPWNTPANRLVKATVSSEVSAAREYAEYLYDDSGRLVFCFVEGGYDEVEHRYYFSDGRLVRFMDGDAVNDSPDQSLAAPVLNRGGELRQAFELLH